MKKPRKGIHVVGPKIPAHINLHIEQAMIAATAHFEGVRRNREDEFLRGIGEQPPSIQDDVACAIERRIRELSNSDVKGRLAGILRHLRAGVTSLPTDSIHSYDLHKNLEDCITDAKRVICGPGRLRNGAERRLLSAVNYRPYLKAVVADAIREHVHANFQPTGYIQIDRGFDHIRKNAADLIFKVLMKESPVPARIRHPIRLDGVNA